MVPSASSKGGVDLKATEYTKHFDPFQTGSIPFLGTHANSAYPFQMSQNAASDQSLHCLLTETFLQTAVTDRIFTRSKMFCFPLMISL